MGTLLIVYRTWYISSAPLTIFISNDKSRTHHKSMQSISHTRTQVEAILLLFIESGAVFAVIQVGDFLLVFEINITVIALQGLDHCHQCTGWECHRALPCQQCWSLGCSSIYNECCTPIIPLLEFTIDWDSVQFPLFCLQALNPVAVVILVQTKNTYEHSFIIEDVPSFPVQSIEMGEQTSGH